MASCPDRYRLVEDEIDKVLTQYRESTHFLFLLRTLLGHVADVLTTICSIPNYFYLDSAVGEQLTFLGERLGWPRCHCVCATTPLFGFECEGFPTEHPLTGFCDGAQTWADCGPFGAADICLTDDEMYRKFVKVRRYQMLSFYDLQSLTEAIQIFWGPTAFILDAGHGRVVIAPGRNLTAAEMSVLQLYPRVLPVAPGIDTRFHFGEVSLEKPVFGFGDGWGGFCEPWEPTIRSISTATDVLETEGDVDIITGPLTKDAPWMCAIDVHPYDCA